jgi:uncharacterized protein
MRARLGGGVVAAIGLFGRVAWVAWVAWVACSSSACSSGATSLGRLDEASPAGSGGSAAGACVLPDPSRHFAFDGVGTEVVDRRGGPSGQLRGGAALTGTGEVALDGDDDFVELPTDLLAGLDEVTVALWVRRHGGPAYTRLFDFGSRNTAATPGGQTYLAATPATGHTPPGLALLFATDGTASEVLVPSATSLDGELRSVIVSVSAAQFALYHEGVLVAQTTPGATVPVSALTVENAWLGRSQYAIDPFLTADYTDVRIYPIALTSCEIVKVVADGPR